MGKIVVEMPENPAELVSNMTILQPSFSSHVSYLLVGGLGGLGRAVSIWMVENGARSLVYLSRSAGKSIEDQNFIKELQSQGCEAVCVPGDVSQLPDVQKAVASCTKPLAGVLQMSMALNDRSFETMTYDDWTSTLAPKISGTWNLHQAVEQEDLDFFVAFSSLGGLCGNIGQANYAAANTFLDSFSQYRQQLGLPCSALVLGAVQDAGFVSQNRKVLQSMQSSSVRLMTAGEVMKGLWKAICQSKMPSSSPVIVGLGNTRPLSEPGVRTMWARDKRFAMYYNLESDVGTVKEVSDNLKVLLAKVEKNPALLDESETETIVRWELGKLITQHMPNAQDMSDEEVNQIVIDSLMSIEIKGWGRRNLGLEISLAEITKAGTVGRLANVVMEHLRDKYSSEN
ncbi:mycolipanoate synthase [Penicillium ochrochloron]